MKRSLAASVLTAAMLAATATALPAPPRAPGDPGPARDVVSSRPQPSGNPSPAPGLARSRRRDPTVPPAAWRELERASTAATALPAQPAFPPLPLPGVLPPPPPLQPSPAPRTAQPPAGPAVEYLGLVEGPAGTFVILRVDGHLHVVQRGQATAGVRIVSATPERVQIRVGTHGTLRNVQRLEPGGRTGP
ncbi:MAG: hypothetical protein QN120_10925 [Armatimonadota bacterium]|nr:hypothetical protein [Armatimonadota bacterium]